MAAARCWACWRSQIAATILRAIVLRSLRTIVQLAEKTAAEKKLELIGWYHSHPDAPARPSEFDREHAWPWYSYIIVSVQSGMPREMNSWRLQDDRAAYDPEVIESPAQSPRI